MTVKELLEIDSRKEITEDNAVEYIRAAIAIIKKLQSELDLSQKLVLELLNQIIETEERYTSRGD